MNNDSAHDVTRRLSPANTACTCVWGSTFGLRARGLSMTQAILSFHPRDDRAASSRLVSPHLEARGLTTTNGSDDEARHVAMTLTISIHREQRLSYGNGRSLPNGLQHQNVSFPSFLEYNVPECFSISNQDPTSKSRGRANKVTRNPISSSTQHPLSSSGPNTGSTNTSKQFNARRLQHFTPASTHRAP